MVILGQAGWAAAPVHSAWKSHDEMSGQPPSASGNWNEIQSRLHSRNLSFRCLGRNDMGGQWMAVEGGGQQGAMEPHPPTAVPGGPACLPACPCTATHLRTPALLVPFKGSRLTPPSWRLQVHPSRSNFQEGVPDNCRVNPPIQQISNTTMTKPSVQHFQHRISPQREPCFIN